MVIKPSSTFGLWNVRTSCREDTMDKTSRFIQLRTMHPACLLSQVTKYERISCCNTKRRWTKTSDNIPWQTQSIRGFVETHELNKEREKNNLLSFLFRLADIWSSRLLWGEGGSRPNNLGNRINDRLCEKMKVLALCFQVPASALRISPCSISGTTMYACIVSLFQMLAQKMWGRRKIFIPSLSKS